MSGKRKFTQIKIEWNNLNQAFNINQVNFKSFVTRGRRPKVTVTICKIPNVSKTEKDSGTNPTEINKIKSVNNGKTFTRDNKIMSD